MSRKSALVASSFIVIAGASSALADILLPAGCRYEACAYNRYLGKTLIDENSGGKLYEVELQTEIRSWETNDLLEVQSSSKSWVYCSTQKPAYIFESDGKYIAHLLNPGGDYFMYNQSGYPVYWTTCHNFVGPTFFSEEMTNRAVQLGYSLNLSSDQIDLRNIRDIMN